MAMATAATKRNATITITPGKPQNPKRYKNQEDDNPIKNLEGFVNSNGGVGVGAKSRPKPFENRYDTEKNLEGIPAQGSITKTEQ